MHGEEVGLYVDRRLFSDVPLSQEELVTAVSAIHPAFRPRAIYVSATAVSTAFTGKAQRSKMKACFTAASDDLGDLRVLGCDEAQV